MKPRRPCVFSIDVEDWFHILDVPSTPPPSEWDRLPSRVERNFLRLLDLAEEQQVRCTCFFLGWVAHRFPHLVTAAARRGHEIASHGWAHRLAYQLTPEEFYRDATKAKDVLEQISGRPVVGYRSAGFSVTGKTDWVFDELLRAGYLYDSSVFPARRSHGGWQNGKYAPYEMRRRPGTLLEFPMTVTEILGEPLCFSGGGYLRLFPLSFIEKMTSRVSSEGRPVIFYIHPREIDPDQPRLPMNAWRQFKTYVNLDTTEAKIRRVLKSHHFRTLEEIAREMLPAALEIEPLTRSASV